MTLREQIKYFIEDSAMEPVAWELYSYYNYLQRTWKNSTGASLVNNTARAFSIKYEVEFPLHKQWAQVMHNSQSLLTKRSVATGPRVLFATSYGFKPYRLASESILAKSLQFRGAQVMSLVCNKTLPACEWNRCGNHNPSPGSYGPRMFTRTKMDVCRNCTHAVLDLYKQVGIPQILLNDFLRTDDMQRLVKIVDTQPYEKYDDFIYKDIKVSEHARSSVLRSLKRGTLQDDEYTRWLYRRYMISTMLLTDLTERLFAAIQPERVVAVHGVYMTHGTICEIARKHNIPVVVYGIPYRRKTIWLSHNDTYHRTLITEPTSRWEHLSLTPENERKLDTYMRSKISGGGYDYVSYHPNPILDKEVLVRELGLDVKHPIVSLFTNVLYDAQIYYDCNAFDNMIDWLFQTIKYFARKTEFQLVIRVHPAEAKGGFPTNQPITGEIRNQFPILPKNVKVIPPESDLSSYTLADISHASLIYATKMGLEIAIRGVPLIVAGETLCRRKGFSYDVETKEQYFKLLDSIPDLPRNSPEMIERAKKFAYHLFFRRMIDFPLFSTTDWISAKAAKLQFQHLEELLPGNNRNLDTICDGILNGSPFVVD